MDGDRYFPVELPTGKYAVGTMVMALFRDEPDRIRLITHRPLTAADCAEVMSDLRDKPREEWQSITCEALTPRKRQPRVVREEGEQPPARRKRA